MSPLAPLRLFALTLSVSLLFCVSAGAQDSPQAQPDTEQAEQQAIDYYDEARQAYSDGHYERAAELLERAYELDDNLIYRYNQILALQGAGDYEAALELLDDHRHQLRDSGMFDDVDEIRAELQQARDERGSEAVAEDSEALQAPPQVDSSSGRLLGWSLVGTGTALLGAGAVFGSGIFIDDTIDRLENSQTIETRRQIYGDGSHSRDADLQTLRTHRGLAIGFLAGGLVVGATGGGLLWSNRNADTTSDGGATLELTPMVDIDTAGAILSGRF